MTEELIKKAEETAKANKEAGTEDPKAETPLEKVERISTETKEMAAKTDATLKRIEEVQANINLGGRGSAGQTLAKPTDDEITTAEAKERAAKFGL